MRAADLGAGMRRAALALALAALAGGAAAQAGPSITVEGLGEVSRAPDMAVVTLSVSAEAPSAAGAVAALKPELDAVLKRVRAEGVAEADVQSSGLSLGQVWDTPRPGQAAKVTGYRAASMLSVKVRALDSLGGLLDAAVKDGANGLSGLSFGLAEPGPAEDAARRAAVADAQHRAALYAEAAGVKLGPVLAISDVGGEEPMPVMRAAPMAAMPAPVPVAAGAISVSASVRIVYAIAP